jgi:hypothetical protein
MLVVLRRHGHRCGYIGVPQGHALYGKSYDDLGFDVHCGLTYAGEDHVTDSKYWLLGFDCAHVCDASDIEACSKAFDLSEFELESMSLLAKVGGEVRSAEYVEQQCRSLVEQINNQ